MLATFASLFRNIVYKNIYCINHVMITDAT